jgi:hypothetical protein
LLKVCNVQTKVRRLRKKSASSGIPLEKEFCWTAAEVAARVRDAFIILGDDHEDEAQIPWDTPSDDFDLRRAAKLGPSGYGRSWLPVGPAEFAHQFGEVYMPLGIKNHWLDFTPSGDGGAQVGQTRTRHLYNVREDAGRVEWFRIASVFAPSAFDEVCNAADEWRAPPMNAEVLAEEALSRVVKNKYDLSVKLEVMRDDVVRYFQRPDGIDPRRHRVTKPSIFDAMREYFEELAQRLTRDRVKPQQLDVRFIKLHRNDRLLIGLKEIPITCDARLTKPAS